MRLLHPFIPFITEEIFQKLPIKSEACIISQYPTIRNDKEWLTIGSKEAAFEMELVKETIAAIRNIRGENQIKPSQTIKARLAPFDARVQKILGENKTVIMRLARLDSCEIGEAGSLAKCAVSPVRMQDAGVDVIVPLEGLVDIEEEIKRINKLIEKIEKDSAVLRGKLGNENYLKNAPEDLVAADKNLLDQQNAQLDRLRESLSRLRM